MVLPLRFFLNKLLPNYVLTLLANGVRQERHATFVITLSMIYCQMVKYHFPSIIPPPTRLSVRLGSVLQGIRTYLFARLGVRHAGTFNTDPGSKVLDHLAQRIV